MADPNADAVVRQMRDAIIDTDLKIMQAVNSRLVMVARLRAYKEAQGMEFVDQAREDWMHSYLASATRSHFASSCSSRSESRSCVIGRGVEAP